MGYYVSKSFTQTEIIDQEVSKSLWTHYMLRDEELPPVYIIIDALDECITGRTELLHLIRNVVTSSKAKWAVSSCNWPEIEEKLSEGLNLSLEVNMLPLSQALWMHTSPTRHLKYLF